MPGFKALPPGAGSAVKAMADVCAAPISARRFTFPLPLAAPCIPPWITRQYSLNIRVSLKEAFMALPQLPARFGALDAAFLNFECKEMPLHIGGVCVFEGVIPFERFVATIESKLDLIPRYREKVMFPFLNIGYPTWQYDPAFDIRRHIFHVKLDPPGTDEQ